VSTAPASTSVTPAGGSRSAPRRRAQHFAPVGIHELDQQRVLADLGAAALSRSTRWSRGWTAGKRSTQMRSKIPMTESLPAWSISAWSQTTASAMSRVRHADAVDDVALADLVDDLHPGRIDLPEDVCTPSRCVSAPWQTKNCEPPVSFPACAIESEPATCLCGFPFVSHLMW